MGLKVIIIWGTGDALKRLSKRRLIDSSFQIYEGFQVKEELDLLFRVVPVLMGRGFRIWAVWSNFPRVIDGYQ